MLFQKFSWCNGWQVRHRFTWKILTNVSVIVCKIWKCRIFILQSNNLKYVSWVKCMPYCARFQDYYLFIHLFFYFLHQIIKFKLASIPEVTFKLWTQIPLFICHPVQLHCKLKKFQNHFMVPVFVHFLNTQYNTKKDVQHNQVEDSGLQKSQIVFSFPILFI